VKSLLSIQDGTQGTFREDERVADLLVLTDAGIVVLMVRQQAEYRRVGTQQLKAVHATEHVNAV